MARLIGTAGHVDHGKTSLIKALTGIDADRLPEEKARGMTIDLGFAYVELPGIGRASIVDVPGHERFLTNMIVGALGVDVALLCVKAADSVMPQTREHLQILLLLPVERLIVALTFADLADDETLQIAKDEVQELLDATRFAGAPVVPVSAPTGDGVAELKDALAQALRETSAAKEGPWYLPIDRAFVLKGQGIVVTGPLMRGAVRAGDEVSVQPGDLRARVRSIQHHGEPTEIAEAGRRTALVLSGIKPERVRRGMIAGEPGTVFETLRFDARVEWVAACKHGSRVRVSLGAEEVIGRAFLNAQDRDLVQLRLESPVGCATFQPLILRDYSPPHVIAGGRVTVPLAAPRRFRDAPQASVDSFDRADSVLALLSADARGRSVPEVAQQAGLSHSAAAEALQRLASEGQAINLSGAWIASHQLTAAGEAIVVALQRMHAAAPSQSSHPRDRVLKAAGLDWKGASLDRSLALLSQAGKVEVLGANLRLPGYRVQMNPHQRQLLDRVEGALSASVASPPSPSEIALAERLPLQAVEAAIKLGLEAGEIVRIDKDMYLTREALRKIQDSIVAAFEDRSFAAAEFRDLLGTSRKFAIPWLEYLDRIRFTLRVGDKRVVRGRNSEE